MTKVKDHNCMECGVAITKRQWDEVAVCEKCMYKSTRPKKTKMRRKKDERNDN